MNENKLWLTINPEIQAATGRVLLGYKSSISYTSLEDWLSTQPVVPHHDAQRYIAEEAGKPIPKIRWSDEFLIFVGHKDKAERATMARKIMAMHTLPKGFRKDSGAWKINPLWDNENPMDSLAHVKDAIKRGARCIIIGNVTKKLWSLMLAAVNVNSALVLVDYSTKDIVRLGHTNMTKDDCFEDKAFVINKVLFENASWRTLQWKLNQPIAEWDSITESVTPLEDDILIAPEVVAHPDLPHWAKSNRYNTRWTRYESKYTVKNQPVFEADPAVNAWLDHEASVAEDKLFNRERLTELTQFFRTVTRQYIHDHADQVWKLFEELGRLESAYGIIDPETEEEFLELPEWVREI